MAEKQSEAPRETKRSYICETCGAGNPVEQVWQCTVCQKNFCVRHLEGTLHNCYGAQKAAHE